MEEWTWIKAKLCDKKIMSEIHMTMYFEIGKTMLRSRTINRNGQYLMRN